jgi:cell division protein FtsZ
MTSTPTIKIAGIGDAGGEVLKRIAAVLTSGIDLIAVNSHAIVLDRLPIKTRLLIAESATHGLGAGGNPDTVRRAALAQADDFRQLFEGARQVYLIAGLGGGTGTGALPVIARLAREMDATVTPVVSQPFNFEGTQRQHIAQAGLALLQADERVVVVNDRLLEFMGRTPEMTQAFELAAGALAWQVLARLTADDE